MIEAIMAGAQLLGNKNAKNSQTADSMAGSLGNGVPMKNWDEVGDDELNEMTPPDLGGFGGF